MRRLLFLFLVLMTMVACSEKTPEERAAHAAQSYYQCLVEDKPDGLLAAKAGYDSLPAAYRHQLAQAYRQYLADIKAKHIALREVRISPNVGLRDSSLHLTYAFLLLCFADSMQEEISVPMVEVDGAWKLR